jgi:hypothetical protein
VAIDGKRAALFDRRALPLRHPPIGNGGAEVWLRPSVRAGHRDTLDVDSREDPLEPVRDPPVAAAEQLHHGGHELGMAAVLLLAGATIAPTEASVYAMVEHVAPAGTLTEAFAWLATAAALGAALGAATGGSLVASLGPIAAFGLAGGAGMLAVLAASLRQATLPGAPSRRESAAAPAAASG